MMRKNARGSVLFSLLLLLAMLLAACGGGEPEAGGETAGNEGGETAGSSDPIKIGAIFDLTGATADVGKPYSQGQVAYIDWLNANGGVAGRQIDFIHSDYSYQVPRAEELYTQYVTQDQVVAFSGWGTGDTEALKTRISEDQIPFISASYSANLANPGETPYNFLVAPTYSDQLIVAQMWALEDWAAQGNSDPPRFAYLVNDSPFGKSPLPDGVAHATANGLEEPLEVPSPRGATDLTPQLTQIRDYGANYVFFQNVSSPVALALKNASDLGFDAQFVCLNWCANELLIQLAGDAAEGMVGAIPFNPRAEGAETALNYAQEQGIDYGGADSNFVQGWWAMAILMEGVERAAGNGDVITGESIKTALESMDGFETGGVTAPITFSSTDHRGTKALQLFQVQEGAWQPITDFMTAEQ